MLRDESTAQAVKQAIAAYHAGDWPAAEGCCRSILDAVGDQFDALNLLGIIAAQTQRPEEAADLLARAVAAQPRNAAAHNNYGNLLKTLKRHEEALDSYDRAISIAPGYADAHNNRGMVLQELQRFDEALDGYERALKLRPDHCEAYRNRGVCLQELDRFEEALGSFDRALAIQPDHAEAHVGRAITLQKLDRFDEALDSYARALQLAPDLESLYGTWLHTKMRMCEWSDLEGQVDNIAAQIARGVNICSPFLVVTLIDSASLQCRAAEIWASASHPARSLPPIFRHSRHERIRVGYFSADYYSHATSHLMAQLFEIHDRSRFELVAFSFGPDIHDEMKERVAKAFDHFLDVRAKSDEEIAALSRELEIDIAVDLKGFTQDGRDKIFACRAAPIQVNYLGYPGTTAAQCIDYIIADRTIIPAEYRRQYSEKIVYLPYSYQVNDRQRRIAEKIFSRTELGLPPDGFVYCCFNNSYKITPATFDGWMRILRCVEGSVLWLLEGNRAASINLRREAEARGIEAARLVFAPRLAPPEHLARHRAADLFIDTLPYNAHTTASDALWAGLPILTRAGECFAARVAASLLNAIGLPELITTTQEQFETLAVELGTNPGRLAELTEKLRRNRLSTPLFDTGLFTRHLEDAYSQMYERHQMGLSPEHIYIA